MAVVGVVAAWQFVVPRVVDHVRQTKLRERIEQVREADGAGATESPTETIVLADGLISYARPTGYLGTQPVTAQSPGLMTVSHKYSYGAVGTEEALMLSSGSVHHFGVGPSPLERVLKESTANQLLADNEIKGPTVTSDRQGDWHGLPYRDVSITGTGSVFARARMILVEDTIYLFEATWIPQTADRANAYFASIQYHGTPVEEPRQSTDRPKLAVTSQPLDLLPLVDVARDAGQGRWIRIDEGLVSPPDAVAAMLTLPVDVPESYELDLTVQRTAGNESFNVGLPVGGSMAMLVIDGFGKSVSGLGVVSGQLLTDRSEAVSGQLLTSEPSVLRIQVTSSSIDVDCDGRAIVRWRGDPDELLIRDQFWKYQPGLLFLGSWSSEFLISKASISR